MSEEIVRFDWDREKLDLIKRTYARGTSDAEFDLFIGVCRRLGLDPMAGQIYCMPTTVGSGEKKETVYKAVVSIDGFRSLAEETGEYEGQTKPEWFDSDSNAWVDVWFGNNAPVAARIGVHRRGFREPLYRVARYDAYVQTKFDGTPNRMWGKMHAEQLLKCAESLALRAAFPRKLANVYTNDEMDQARAPEREVVVERTQERTQERPKVASPPSQPRAASAPSTGRATFRWKANPRYDNTFVDSASADVITEYITYLNDIYLSKPEKKGLWPEVNALKKQCEEILRVQLLLEQAAVPTAALTDGGLGKTINDKLQSIIDGRLPDPTDANRDWGMNDDERGSASDGA